MADLGTRRPCGLESLPANPADARAFIREDDRIRLCGVGKYIRASARRRLSARGSDAMLERFRS